MHSDRLQYYASMLSMCFLSAYRCYSLYNCEGYALVELAVVHVTNNLQLVWISTTHLYFTVTDDAQSQN